MKKILFIILFTIFITTLASSQIWDLIWENDQLRIKLGLTEDEIKQLQHIFEQAEEVIRLANADLQIKRAEMERLLMDKQVDLKTVEKILRQAMELELKIRLAQITREVKAKQILGEKRWAQINRKVRSMLKERRERMEQNEPGK